MHDHIEVIGKIIMEKNLVGTIVVGVNTLEMTILEDHFIEKCSKLTNSFRKVPTTPRRRDFMVIEQIKAKIKNKEYELNDIPLLLKAIEEITNSNEDLIKELKDQENLIIQLTIEGALAVYLEIRDGKFLAGDGTHENPTVSISMSEKIARGLMSGELDTATSYTQGDIQITGKMAKAIAIRSILEIVGENLGLDIGT